MLANEQQVRRGIRLSVLSALLQAAVAIGFVLIAAAALRLTALAMNEATHWIGLASYGMVALLGLWLIVRKLFGGGHEHAHGASHHPHHEDTYGAPAHHHVIAAEATKGSWREQLGVVVAVGLRPCSGALVVLAFALSQEVLLAGIAAVLLMALGTALTVAVLAILAVGMKNLAYSAAGGGTVAAGLVWWAELLGALVVFGFGTMLLLSSL
jgi:ABC-type nickel/cobalt efflux system permease component RcnA